MVSNDDVARAFSCGRSLTAGNMFSEGDVVYSYGYHFPIAIRLGGGKYLFNKDGYSSTTGCHKSLVLAQIPQCSITFVSTEKLKEAISIGATNVLMVDKEFKFDDVEQMQVMIEDFFKSKGVNTLRIRNRLKPFIDEMKKIIILSEV